ncbi:MAG TPA: hypothetical protein VID27_21495 [Blastocatellia bacterium]|jgi:hypothetical protein
MGAASTEFSLERSSAYRAILWGGLIVGALDITAACISNGLRAGRSPVWVFQSVASGLLGADSFTGGLATAALGLALHFMIATIWTTAFYLASRKLEFLVQHAVASGLLYGIVVYSIMYFVVLPLSAIHAKPSAYTWTSIIINVGIHLICIGLPIALVVRWQSGAPRENGLPS